MFVVLSSRLCNIVIVRVHPVHAMNAEQRQAAADLWTKRTDLSLKSVFGTEFQAVGVGPVQTAKLGLRNNNACGTVYGQERNFRGAQSVPIEARCDERVEVNRCHQRRSQNFLTGGAWRVVPQSPLIS